jgi:hypothetical protein
MADDADAMPSVEDVSVAVEPDDGADGADGAEKYPHSIQVSSDAKVTLTWSTQNATAVHIDPLGDFDASGSTALPASDATYEIIAVDGDGQQSLPYPLEVHTHAPGETVSQHVDVSAPGSTPWLLDFKVGR